MHALFRKRMTALGLPDNVQEFILDEMTAPHRHYHTLGHLALMLKVIDEAYGKNCITREDGPSVVVATLFHDVVYDATASDNEERSAIEAKLRLDHRRFNIPLISSLIMATKGHDLTQYRERTDPHYWIVYADLSILWGDWPQYEWYAHGVRKEYAHVPAEAYRVGRAQVLNHLKDTLENTFGRPEYIWTVGGDPLMQLRENVAWELAELQKGTFDVA
jgi:predicted metal-dependent HD superfamily phosphohydrolase